tara:strand:+ start:2033 stop:3016 length:984 start_codon:yes stop_codon:yes gene_type:complete
MKNLLLEEIERYRKLSKYNPKLTLTENVNIISEKGPNFNTLVQDVAKTFGKDISLVMKDLKIAGMDAGRVTKLLEMDAKSFEKEWVRALQGDIKSGFPKGEVGSLTKELSKIDFLKRVTNEVKAQGKVLKPAEFEVLLKNVKTEAQSAAKVRAAKFTPKIPRTPNPKDIKSGEDVVRIDPSLKKLDWKSLVKKGAVLGLSVGALYYIYKLSHKDEPPIVGLEDEAPKDTEDVIKTDNARYRNCDNVTTYTKGCKTEKIKQLQTCLGLVPDGKFWEKTQAALVAKGYKNGFTDADIPKICGDDNPTPGEETLNNPTPGEETIDDVNNG